MTVTPIKPGPTVANQTDEERQFVAELAVKVRGFVEAYGRLPDCAVVAMWTASDTEGMNWAASYFSPKPARGKIEAYGTAIGVLTKSIAL